MMRRTMLVIGIFMLIGAACAPARSLIPVPSATVPATLQALPTSTQTSTQLPTSTRTLTATTTAKPSETQSSVLIPTFSAPSATMRPTRTQTQTISPTATPTATTDLQATGTAPPPTPFCPIPTAEPFWVDPVISPTDQLSQVNVVRIGNGEEVTVVTESGIFTGTGNFGTFLVEISLLPNIVHHLEVSAKVRTVSAGNGCIYGGYTLRTTGDEYGNPLIIVQGEPIP